MSGREHWVAMARPPRGAVGRVRRTRAPDEIAPFLSDAAHYPGGHAPELCEPASEAEVAAILREARAVLAIGAQSSLTGGATPRGETLLSTRRMAAIEHRGSDRVHVGPGVVLRTVLDELRARGADYPPVPTYDGASVGGTVATNAAGAATFKYGTTRDWVAALTVVLATGDVLDLARGQVTARDDGRFRIVRADGAAVELTRPALAMPRVPKHSAGYFSAPGMDLIDLFIGAEGTLGVVTAVTLRVLRPAPVHFVGLVPLADDRAALALTAALRGASRATRTRADRRGIDVAAIEYLDRRSLAILREDGAPARAGVPLPADAAAALVFQAELPPPMDTTRAANELARLDDATCDTSLVRLCRLLRDHGALATTVPALPGEDGKRAAIVQLREAVPEGVNRRIREAQRADGRISKAACDVIVPFEHLATSLERYRAILAAHDLDHAIWGHVSDGNVHPNALPRTGEEMARAKRAQLALGQAAIDLGGCPMSEHGTGRDPVKQALLERLYGAVGVHSMRAVKRTLDPAGVLAPGVVFAPDPSRDRRRDSVPPPR